MMMSQKEQPARAGMYSRWTTGQVLAAVALARRIGVRPAARVLKVPKSTVGGWLQQMTREWTAC